MNCPKRTDLLFETSELFAEIPQEGRIDGATFRHFSALGSQVTEIVLDEFGAKYFGKPSGSYYTIPVGERLPSERKQLAAVCGYIVKKILMNKVSESKTATYLTVGLGNEKIAADSLGVKTASKVLATAQFKGLPEYDKLGLSESYTVCPGVFGETGFDTAAHVKLIAESAHADAVIVVDSLTCSGAENIGAIVQITDTGITPGSGVKNARSEISERVLGIPVIAIGIPTVSDTEIGNSKGIVTLRDIDGLSDWFAVALSGAINSTVNSKLSPKEIELLIA
jgi:spore protease